jgi:chorismate mutase
MNYQLDIRPLISWLGIAEKPLVISGPCSAETEEQLLSTAHALAHVKQVRLFRAGIWKPRTRPYAFEGVGEVGLKWLQRVKQETGLFTTVEVATPQHVELALKYNIDVLWIGARTVVNPFSIQEVAEALQGIPNPVMVKNPISPDLKLWIGALERLNRAGIKQLAAIHRGFFSFNKTPYRNAPMWELPIELRRIFPSLPIVVDPSHICGRADLLQGIAQKALDLNMDGLMIESHISPSTALSDADQQITPERLKTLLDSLTVRQEKGSSSFENLLEELRSEIDKIDSELLEILSRRMQIVTEIGKTKKDSNIMILQIERWRTIINKRLADGTKRGLSAEFLKSLLELVHGESIRIQNNIMNEPDPPD